MPRYIGLSTVAVLVALMVSGCNQHTGPGPVVPVALTITGPTLLAPGQTAAFTATALFSDGTSSDVTGSAIWTPVTSVCQGCPFSFSSRGIGEGVRPGGEIAHVSYAKPGVNRTVTADLPVDVLSPGTFKITGTLTANGAPTSAKVEVVSGAGTGLQITSFGSYALYGVAGAIQLQVSSDGFVSQTRDVSVNGPGVTSDFSLVLVNTPTDVGGDWTMTLVGPSNSCSAGFPAAAHNRTYRLHMTQSVRNLDVTISGPSVEVVEQFNNDGVIDGDKLLLDFMDGLDDFTGANYTNIFDHVTAADTISFAGRLTGTVSGSEVASSFAGEIRYWSGANLGRPTGAPTWACRAADHVVTLRR